MNIPLGWSRSDELVIYRTGNSIASYDEADLRDRITQYISDESRSRFMNDGLFFDGLKHLMVGLELFYAKTN